MSEKDIKAAFERFYNTAMDVFVRDNRRAPTAQEERHIRMIVRYAVAVLIVEKEKEEVR